MKNILFALLIVGLIGGSGLAQNSKEWKDWSKKDADKLLHDSAWAQTIKKGEAPPVMTSRSGSSGSQQMGVQGPAPIPTEVFMRIRLITAKPVREGFAARLLRLQPNPPAELVGQLQTIIDGGFGEFIVVAVNADGPNPQTLGMTLQMLARLKAADLVNKVYIERKDGKRLQLLDYKAPVADDMGGKFVFERNLDGSPFLTSDSGSLRFVLDLSGNLKLNAKFDVSKMTYNGKLEY